MDSTNIQKELEVIAQQEALLNKKKEELLKIQRQQEEFRNKTIQIFNESGFKTPQDLINALCDAFQIKEFGQTKSGKATRKRRTRVDAQLVKSVKEALSKGLNRNQVAKEFGLSYPTITKIRDGGYDS